MAQALRDDPTQSIQTICKTMGISRTTFYRHTEAQEHRRSTER
jgi:ACT domain-containing protein